MYVCKLELDTDVGEGVKIAKSLLKLKAISLPVQLLSYQLNTSTQDNLVVVIVIVFFFL